MKDRAIVAGVAMGLLIAASAVPAWAQDGSSDDYIIATDYTGALNYVAVGADGPDGVQQYIGSVPVPYYTYGGGAVGDFDADGDLDYVIGTGQGWNAGTRRIYLYEKTGAGAAFAAPVQVGTWDTGSYAMDIGTGDFNEDGHLDFLMVHYGAAQASLYLGNGNFGFQYVTVPNSTPVYSIGVAVADFNADGHLDFTASDWGWNNGQITVSLGDGSGAFQTTSLWVGQGNMWSVAAGDFDEDGHADIVAPHYYSSQIRFLRGNGDGTFQPVQYRNLPMVTGGYATPMKAYDFNDDGHLDLVTGEYYDVRYYEGHGDGTFTFRRAISGGAGSYRYGLATPSEGRSFRITEIEATQGAISVLGGADGGVLPGIGEFSVRISLRGHDVIDLSTLAASLPFVTIADAQQNGNVVTVRLTVPSFSTAAGDFPLSFSVTTASGQTIQTQNSVVLTILDPYAAGERILETILDLQGQANRPQFVARINSQVIARLDQIDASVQQLYEDGFTAQAQELMNCLAECRAQAQALTGDSTPSNAAQVQSRLMQAANQYTNHILPGIASLPTTFAALQTLLQSLATAGTRLEEAAANAYGALATAIGALVADNATLELFVYRYAETALNAQQFGQLDTPALLQGVSGTGSGALPQAQP